MGREDKTGGKTERTARKYSVQYQNLQKVQYRQRCCKNEYHGRIFTIRAESHGVCKTILVIFLKNLESILKLPNI